MHFERVTLWHNGFKHTHTHTHAHTHARTHIFRLFVPSNIDPGVHICLQKASLFIDLHYVQVLFIKKSSDMTVKCTVITKNVSSSQKLIHQLKQKPKNKQTQKQNPILIINYVCVCMHVHASVFANKSKHSNVQQCNQTWKDKYIWNSCQKQKNIMYTDLFLLSLNSFTRIKLTTL